MSTVMASQPAPSAPTTPARAHPTGWTPGSEACARPRGALLGSRPSAELAVAVRSGDPEAAGELYRRVRDRAHRAARAFCAEADVDDAVAEGIARALARISQLRNPESVEAWLVRCVVRCAIDLSRQRRRQTPTDAVEWLREAALGGDESASDAAMCALDCAVMAAALRDLQPGPRMMLYLRYEAGLSVQHIASVLGRPAGTIRRQCVEARRAAGQRFLCRHLQPAVGPCAQITELLCQQQYRRPAVRVRRRTAEHLRGCQSCRDRQAELEAVLRQLGQRPRTCPIADASPQT